MNEFEVEKKLTTIMSNVSVTMREECEKNIKEMVHALKSISVHKLNLAKILHENYTRGLYKFMGFETYADFSEYYGVPRAYARKLKDTYKHWCIINKFSIKDIQTIKFTKLTASYKFLKVVNTSIEKKQFLEILSEVPNDRLYWIKIKDVEKVSDISRISDSIISVDQKNKKSNAKLISHDTQFDILTYLDNPQVAINLAHNTKIKLTDVKSVVEALKNRIVMIMEVNNKRKCA